MGAYHSVQSSYFCPASDGSMTQIDSFFSITGSGEHEKSDIDTIAASAIIMMFFNVFMF